MFQIDTGDFKLMFEYETEEELRTALEHAKEIQIQSQVERFREVKEHVASSETMKQGSISFEQLRDKYILKQKRAGLSVESISEYMPTFKKLTAYFKERNVGELVLEDYEQWKEYLTTTPGRGGDPLSKKTMNKHLGYLKSFLKEIMLEEIANEIPIYRKSVIKKETPKKENYTQQEVHKILNYEYKNPILKAIIKIALYTGMRQGEIRKMSQENIKKDKNSEAYYFDIPEAKSEAGVREIPIHKDIEELVLSLSFPLFPDLVDNKNAFGKKVRYALYKAVNEPNKNFHTLRANFIDRIIEDNYDNPNPFSLNIIQAIVGHEEGDRVNLTIKVYKKGFRITDKKLFIDKVAF